MAKYDEYDYPTFADETNERYDGMINAFMNFEESHEYLGRGCYRISTSYDEGSENIMF